SMKSPNPSPRTVAHEQNRRAWDAMARQQQRFAQPFADDEFRQALESLDPAGWLEGSLAGRRLLCLGSGGGRQGALYAAAGAIVTVVDISSEMLDLDREVAAARGYSMRLVQASIDDLSVLAAASLDVVAQPV